MPSTISTCIPEPIMEVLRRPECIKAPLVLQATIMLIMLTTNISRWVDSLETFAGKHEVTSAMRRHGYAAIAYELLLDRDSMDIMTGLGFSTCLSLALMCKDGAFSMNAPVCSTWVFMSRSSTGRTSWKPLGNGSDCVSYANAMVGRMTLLLYVYTALGFFWVVEQPVNSLMEFHPQLAALFKQFPTYKVKVRMGEFGGKSEKPAWLYSNYQFIENIQDHKTKTWTSKSRGTALVDTYIDRNGVKRIVGNKSLKLSQAS